MERKDFLRTCGYACISGTVLSALLQSCSATNYFAQATFTEKLATIKKSEFIDITNEKNTERKYVLLKTDKLNYPVYISKSNNDTYVALLLECTHKGCEVQPQGDYLICPCHGSEFSNTGVVQSPPAEQNLKTFQVTSDNENIYIHF